MLFGSSGIRRKFDHTLADTALKIGSALASGSPDIIIGMDTRTTSPAPGTPGHFRYLRIRGKRKECGYRPHTHRGIQYPDRSGRVHDHRFPQPGRI